MAAEGIVVSQAVGFGFVRRRLFINSTLFGVSRVLSTCTSLVTVPIIVAKLGLGGFGGWEAMMAIAALVTGFQVVLSGTLIWKMSAAYGDGDYAAIQRLAGLGLEVVTAVCIVICPVVWIMRFQLVELSSIPPPYKATAALVIPWLIVQTILGGVGETFGAVLTAHQRAGLTTLIQTGALMANSAFAVFGLLNGWQVWSLLLGNTVGVLIAVFGLYLAVVAVRGPATVRFYIPSWKEGKPLLKYGGFLALGALSLSLRDQADKVILAGVGNSTWTAWFGLASRLANLVLTVCSFFYVPLIAATAALHARGDWTAVRKLYDNAMITMPFLTGAFVVLIASSYDRLLVMWIGRAIPQVGPILFILLVGNITAVVLTGAGSSLCKGIGRADIEAAYIIVCVLCNVVLKLVLTRLLGPIGSVLSSAASWAIGAVVFAVMLSRTLDIPNTVLRAAAMIPVMAVAIALAHVVASTLPASVTRWHAVICASGIGAFGVASYCALLVCTRILPVSVFRRLGAVCLESVRPETRCS